MYIGIKYFVDYSGNSQTLKKMHTPKPLFYNLQQVVMLTDGEMGQQHIVITDGNLPPGAQVIQ